MNEYEKQAMEFCEKHHVKITSEYEGHRKYFPDDDSTRAVFQVTIERKDKKPYTFTFGQSLVDSYEGRNLDDNKLRFKWQKLPFTIGYKSMPSIGKTKTMYAAKHSWEVRACVKPPTPYDILAVVQKYDPGSFEDFCSEFGYDFDSRKAGATFHAVDAEWHAVERIFGDCLEELQEIN